MKHLIVLTLLAGLTACKAQLPDESVTEEHVKTALELCAPHKGLESIHKACTAYSGKRYLTVLCKSGVSITNSWQVQPQQSQGKIERQTYSKRRNVTRRQA